MNVRPRITLQKVGRNSFLVVVLAQHSMAGKTWTSRAGAAPGWATIAQAQLQSIARTSTVAVGRPPSGGATGSRLRLPFNDAIHFSFGA